MKLFSNSINLLENSLAYSVTKQKVISNNIANIDTPNYKGKEVSFKAELENASLKAHRLNSRHIDFKHQHNESGFQIRTQQNTSYNHNGNNVDIDKEMAEMAQNQIYYNLIADRLSSKFKGLKETLKGANG